MDLAMLEGILEVQIITLEAVIENEHDEVRKVYFTTELKQYKSVHNKLKKILADY